jgi:hypothetical protein
VATNPIPAIHTTEYSPLESPLTHQETRDLIFSLYGSAKEMLAEVGGSDAWIRFLRDEEESQEPES